MSPTTTSTAQPANPLILAHTDRDILYITINRPEKHNALSSAALNALRDTFLQHAGDANLKAAVLRGAGEKSFAAGGDLVEFDSMRTAEQVLDMRTLAKGALDAVRNFPVPVIAALNGHARGGGAELAVACDLRISTHGARIGFIQRRLNITTAWGGGVDLMKLVGPARGLHLLTSGELIDAQTAQAMGLIEAVATPEQSLSDLIEQFTESFRALTPLVARGYKSLSLAEKQGASSAQMATLEQQSLVTTWIHDDHWSAVAKAFNPGKK